MKRYTKDKVTPHFIHHHIWGTLEQTDKEHPKWETPS